MDINALLFNEIHDILYDYDCREDQINHFLTIPASFDERQKEAIKIIEGIMTVHGKKELLSCVAELARIEHGIRELEPWARDHVVHALLSFLLGIYIQNKFFALKGISVNEFQWKLAGLFHDVGYPVQIAKDAMLSRFAQKINDIKDSIGVSTPDIHFKIVPVGLEKLKNDINSFELIQAKINEWGLQINPMKEYKRMTDSGNICHGMISALAVLYLIDLMYQKNNPKRERRDIYKHNINFNQVHFETDVVSACAAIFIHNLPDKCFKNAKIDCSKAPLAFLLKLSDCLQEWDRPSLNNTNGYPSSKFDMHVKDGKLVFRSDVSIENKGKIEKEIISSLIASDVLIR
jgi:hypothetical protein